MISTDWIFAIPLTWHLGNHWLRFCYHHMSSHIGDEYIVRFDAPVGDYSRDAADFTAFHKVSPGLGVYGGGSWAFNVHPKGSGRLLARAGVQAESSRPSGATVPYAAADVQWDQNNDWEPRLNMQIGIRLPDYAARDHCDWRSSFSPANHHRANSAMRMRGTSRWGSPSTLN